MVINTLWQRLVCLLFGHKPMSTFIDGISIFYFPDDHVACDLCRRCHELTSRRRWSQ